MLGIGSSGVLTTHANKTKPKPTIFAIDSGTKKIKQTNNECVPEEVLREQTIPILTGLLCHTNSNIQTNGLQRYKIKIQLYADI